MPRQDGVQEKSDIISLIINYKFMNRNILIAIAALVVLGVGAIIISSSSSKNTNVNVGDNTAGVTTAGTTTGGDTTAGSTTGGTTTGTGTGGTSGSSVSDFIHVTSPKPNDVIKSPVNITGEARGTWYFEASFPIKLYDANNKLLGTVAAQAQGDWMTNNFVPFKATMNFAASTTSTGTMVFEKDNPSGLPQNAMEYRMPVRFETSMRTVKLYYYNINNDKDTNGNVICSNKGLVAVNRQIPVTNTPIQDTIRLLIKGELTASERSQGLSTEFPLPGFTLKSASLANGVLTLEFNDPQNKTTGGSCRVKVLQSQIEATAKQFPGVNTVRIIPQTLFQP